jgi:putative Mg2+ transporter-C (MgtC) family protein
MMILQLQLLGEMLLAMILGGIIGYERETADKPAGLRTHMLVAGAATLLTGLGRVLVSQSGIEEAFIQADPIRIVEAIITGVAFLGAGTILRRQGKNQVEGLTTAASLLMAAAVGISVALQQFVLASGATVIVLFTLHGLKLGERKKANKE